MTFPLSKEEKKLIQHAIDHLTYSQIEEYEKKYDLRPGMGLAFPQVGINKRLIVIVNEYQKEPTIEMIAKELEVEEIDVVVSWLPDGMLHRAGR